MTAAAELWVFAGVIVLGQFSPGPDMLLITRTALREGPRAGVEMAAGIACGLAVHSTVAVAGVAMAFQRLPWLRNGLRWAAAVYLAWLAWGILHERFISWRSGGCRGNEAPGDGRGPFLRGFLCNLLNPKVALFLSAVCAPFLEGGHPVWRPLAIWGVIVGLGFFLWSGWVYLLQWRPFRSAHQRAAGWIDTCFGLLLLGLALRLMIGP